MSTTYGLSDPTPIAESVKEIAVFREKFEAFSQAWLNMIGVWTGTIEDVIDHDVCSRIFNMSLDEAWHELEGLLPADAEFRYRLEHDPVIGEAYDKGFEEGTAFGTQANHEDIERRAYERGRRDGLDDGYAKAKHAINALMAEKPNAGTDVIDALIEELSGQ